MTTGSAQVLERLRLAVGLAHAVPGSVLTVRPDAGPVVTVSDALGVADLSVCRMRRLVADHLAGSPVPGLSWLLAVDGLELGGADLLHAGDGVVRQELSSEVVWWWASTLQPEQVRMVLQREAQELVGVGDWSEAHVGSITVGVHHDAALAVSVVGLGDRGYATLRDSEQLVRELARAGALAEVLHNSRLGDHPGPRVRSRRVDHPDPPEPPGSARSSR